MDQNRQVDVGSLLESVSAMLMQNQQGLNRIDSGAGGGTHGERMARAFRAAADAAKRAPSDDAGRQLEIAAEEMRRVGRGRAAGYYADGLEQAAQQFQGQQGISIDDLLPFLQAFLGGVQRNNPAQPGQGTMIDALLPAVTDFMEAKQQGLDTREAIMRALGSAVTGARSTTRRPTGGGILDEATDTSGGYIDPGAASATNVIGGLVGALLPSVLGGLQQQAQPEQQPMRTRIEQPSIEQPQGGRIPSGLGIPIGQGQSDDPLGGLGGLIGLLGQDFLGAQDQGRREQGEGRQSSSSW